MPARAGSQRSSVLSLFLPMPHTHMPVQVATCPPLGKDASLNTMLAQWAQAEAAGMETSLVCADTQQVWQGMQAAIINCHKCCTV